MHRPILLLDGFLRVSYFYGITIISVKEICTLVSCVLAACNYSYDGNCKAHVN